MNIFIDWGSTNFRAFLCDGDKIIDRRQSTGAGTLKGFAGVTPETRAQAYSAFFIEQLGDWLKEHNTPAYICGAVGGREGWVETKYSEAPAAIEDVRRNLHKVGPQHIGSAAGHDVYIASGCCIAFPDGRHDVMRSEEVKSLGAALHLGLQEALLAIPGTHNKWVLIKDGKIVHFETALSGEVYALMGEHGGLAAIFRASPTTGADFDSFDRGMAMAERGFDLLTDLWQVRAQKLRDPNPPADMKAYFSGILLGHELRQMEKFFPGKPPVVLLADEGPKRLYYRHAFSRCNWKIQAEVNSEVSVIAGLSALK